MSKYKDAINWLAEECDNAWLAQYKTDGTTKSVSARLVCYLFKKPIEKMVKDLEKAIWEADNTNRGNG